MPRHRKNGSRNEVNRLAPALAALTLLSACIGGGDTSAQHKAFAGSDQTVQAGQAALAQSAKPSSALIADLQARKSVLLMPKSPMRSWPPALAPPLPNCAWPS
jgi:hypothetical protein